MRASSEKSNSPGKLRCYQLTGELAAMASATDWRPAAGAWNSDRQRGLLKQAELTAIIAEVPNFSPRPKV